MRILLSAIAIAVIGSPAWAQNAVPAPAAASEKGDPPVGSHIAGTSTCHTVAEWEEIHRNTQDFLSRAQSGASHSGGR
jgi:hypothetical protein